MQKKKEIHIEVAVFEKFSDLSILQQQTLQKAQEACENSHSPYSNFQVGAAVLLEDGTFVLGSNQENAAYPSGLCAERTAIYYASSQYPHLKIKSVAVTARKTSQKDIFLSVSPCGACRQAMLEYECKQITPITLLCSDGAAGFYEFFSIKETLPLSFTSKSLE